MTNGLSLSAADIAIVISSLVLVVGVGIRAGRGKQASARGYFLAAGRLPWYIIGAAFVSTSVSSEQIVGTMGQVYRTGMGVANWEWFTVPVYTLMILFFVPVFLRSRIATVPEFLARRFGPFCGDVYSWVMCPAYVFVFLVPVLYGGSLALAELTGWNFRAVLWAMVLLVGVYTVKGGLSSVMWTDAVQCVMLVGGGLLLYFLALGRIPGGWTAMEQAAPARFHLYHSPSDPVAPFLALVLGTFGVFIFYQAANQVMVQRILGARTCWDGMTGMVFAGFINLLRPLVTCFLGLVVWHWIHAMHQAEPLANADRTFAFALKTFAPGWGLRGIVLAGFLAAVMSTVSALANSTATIFSLDIYKRFVDRRADDRRLIRVGRIVSAAALVVAALAVPLVEKFGGIFLYFQQGVTYLAVPFITVIWLGLLWKRTNYPAACFGLLGGFAIMLLAVTADGLLQRAGLYARLGLPNGLHWIYLAFVAQILTAAGMVAVTLATPAAAPSQWQPFQWSPACLKLYEDGAVRPWYQNLWLWYAVFVAIWGILYWRFW